MHSLLPNDPQVVWQRDLLRAVLQYVGLATHGLDPEEVATLATGAVLGTVPDSYVPSIELRLLAVECETTPTRAALQLSAVALELVGRLAGPEEQI